jgi:catechol 2,3-dioxygenase-like lactoylglutathione lyase family enzyme
MLAGVDHVQLAAPPGCEDEARRFFGELLGMKEVEKPEALRGRGGVWFQVGAQQLHVGVEADHRPARKAHPAFSVRGYGDLLARLRSGGIAVRDDQAIPGVRRCYVSDPWGNRIELVSAE